MGSGAPNRYVRKEPLPIPVGESDIISNFTTNTPGHSFASGDTGKINGGAAGFSALYRVGSVLNGTINGEAINNGGRKLQLPAILSLSMVGSFMPPGM